MKIDFEKKIKGVSLDRKNNKWRARITAGNTRCFLGRFDKREHAVIARVVAERLADAISRQSR